MLGLGIDIGIGKMTAVSKLGLGTVQWGLPYGISNQQGMTSPQTVKLILNEAQHCGVEVLDTASLYGSAEAVLGANSLERFKVITKTPAFTTPRVTEFEINQLRETFENSLSRLVCKKVYGLLIHHADNLLVPGGDKLLMAMKQLKDHGLVDKIGVSVYDDIQIDNLLKTFKPDLIQLPLNVLDQRMLVSGHLDLLKNEGIEIHVRSVFLQGLLLMPLGNIPVFFEPIRPLLTHWHNSAHEQGLTVNQAAIAFVKNIPHVDTVLLGVESLEQFRACQDDFLLHIDFDATGLACHDSAFINPSFWKRT